VLDAGVPLRDAQEAASHADPRTTMRYDRARGSLDRHATCIVAAYVAGAARYRRTRREMLRLTVVAARQSCLSLPSCGKAPRPQREREPLIGAAT
jgi:hypothetical protein